MVRLPWALIGITLGLLITGQPFGFVALLAAVSLAGMMIKNAIVLVDEIDVLQTAGQSPFEAVMNAAVSRLRPVLLAAGTTVLGVIPLLSDVFWVSMAVAITFGLTLGTFITMVILPTMYSLFFRIREPADVRGSLGTMKVENWIARAISRGRGAPLAIGALHALASMGGCHSRRPNCG